MSGYILGLFWNNGQENFDFTYCEKEGEKSSTINTCKIDESFIENVKDKSLTVEIHNISIDKINTHLCQLNINSILFNRCKINSIGNLKDIKNLKKITIIDSDIKGIDMLAENELEYLSVINSQNLLLSEIVNIKNLRELYYKSNIKTDNDLINLEGLSNLTILNLSDNNIKSVENMGLLKDLISIDISINKIESIDVLKNNTKLKYVYLQKNNIKDIRPLKLNKNIKYLMASHNNFSEIDFIENLNDIELLNLQNNPIKVVPNLLNLKNLNITDLNIDWKNVDDLKGMKGYQILKNIMMSLSS
jgi:Leucine-rich repeat (LRR) protein